MDKSTDKVKLNDELLDQVSGGYEPYRRSENEGSGPATTPRRLEPSEVRLEQTGMPLRPLSNPRQPTSDMSVEKPEIHDVPLSLMPY